MDRIWPQFCARGRIGPGHHGVLDGDWVVVRSQPNAEQGEFVAALLDGEATVKEFHRDSTGVWLLPHNDAFEPIKGDEAEIMGRVISVFRTL